MNRQKDRKEEDTKKEEKCQHTIVDDLIDIDPDRSIIIYYCKHCFDTFDRIIRPKDNNQK